MKVLILSGSPRPKSRTLLVAGLLGQLLRREGAQVRLWDLAALPVPIIDPTYHDDPAANPDPVVRQLVAQADSADALVLASPIYHGSFSGVLKNALDNLSTRQLSRKPVGLAAFGGSLMAVQACDQLRLVVRALHGLAVPTQLVAVKADLKSSDDGLARIDNPELAQRGRRMVRELVMFAGRGETAPAQPAVAEVSG